MIKKNNDCIDLFSAVSTCDGDKRQPFYSRIFPLQKKPS